MSIKVIMFDLDGTLLPMDQDLFIKAYFSELAKKLANRGYEPEKLINSIMYGTMAMIKNDGSCTNEERFWNAFSSIYGEKVREDEPYFEKFYLEEFDKVSKVCGYSENATKVIGVVKSLGYKIILATNPIFPKIATKKRIKWAGLNEDDFELITTYENSRFSKPNLKYYQEIMGKFNFDPSECVMVGNNVSEDMIVENLGVKTFLLTDCLINKENIDINNYSNGSFDELIKFLKSLKNC